VIGTVVAGSSTSSSAADGPRANRRRPLSTSSRMTGFIVPASRSARTSRPAARRCMRR
jgi:hypothetical protein